jgi:hypothetical protein
MSERLPKLRQSRVEAIEGCFAILFSSNLSVGLTMTLRQCVLRFDLGRVVMGAQEWSYFLRSRISALRTWDGSLVIHSGLSELHVIAMTPRASEILGVHVDEIARAVRSRAGAVPVSIDQFDLRCRPNIDTTYVLPCVIMADGREGAPWPSWEELREKVLSPASARIIEDRVRAQIKYTLRAFEIEPPEDSVQVRLIDSGASMPIQLAPVHDGQRRTRYALSRKGLRFMVSSRLMGFFSLGRFRGMGFGRMYQAHQQN